MGETIDATHGEGFRSGAGPPNLRYLERLLAESREQSTADSLNAATKYLATHRPDSLGWGPVEDLGPDIVEGVRRIRAKDGPDLIVWGSSTLTPVLLEHGLADEVLLLVYPILLGTGKRFFSDGARHANSRSSTRRLRPRASSSATYRPSGPSDRLLRRRGGVSLRQRSCRERDDDHHRGLLLEREYVFVARSGRARARISTFASWFNFNP
jgi:dihydrofolate reductase